MTALKPIENMTKVRGVPSKRYPPAKVCSHPECTEDAESNHHIFGRIGEDGDSWFVALESGGPGLWNPDSVIPAVASTCGSGTTKHHGDLEEHRAWIKYEDGEFVWYERQNEPPGSEGHRPLDTIDAEWERIGPLKPQPGEPARPYKRPKRKENEGPVQVVSFKAPQEDPEAAERIKVKVAELLERFTKGGHKIGKTVAVERALDYTLLNAERDEF